MSNHTRIMMKLGGYSFGIDTAAYQSLSRATKYRWAKHARPGKNPRMEFLGPDDETMSLPGTIYTVHAGGLSQVDDMRKQASMGDPLLMVDGYGGVHGYWCVTSIRETKTHFLPGGAPQKITFTLDMTYYGDSIA